jgi:hypothetical protein
MLRRINQLEADATEALSKKKRKYYPKKEKIIYLFI